MNALGKPVMEPRSSGGHLASAAPISTILQPLWRGHAAVIGWVKIIAVGTTDRDRSAVIARIARRVISTGRGSTDGSSADRSTDAYRHSRAYATVNATAVDAPTVDATAIIGRGVC